jgi:drug/metabolite transporter (DMT)-like permease
MEVTPVEILILFNAIQPEKALAPMEVTLVGILILVNKEQPKKALAPIEVTLVGIVILVNEEQPEKALAAILVTVVGIFITANKLVRPVNPYKLVGVPVVVYVNPPSGLVQVNPDQFPFDTEELKAKVKFRILYLFAKGVGVVKAALLEFASVKYTFAVEEIFANTFVPIFIDDFEKMYTLFNKLQPEKALSPMLITPVGIVILVNPEQPEKTLVPIEVNLELVGIVILVNVEQL